MNYKIFSLAATGDEAEELLLNQFLARHKIIQVDRQFVALGDLSYWSLCVGYQATNKDVTNSNSSKKPRIDYKEVLTEPQFAQFAALRELRKTIASQEGVPVFAIFSNEQLAQTRKRRLVSRL